MLRVLRCCAGRVVAVSSSGSATRSLSEFSPLAVAAAASSHGSRTTYEPFPPAAVQHAAGWATLLQHPEAQRRANPEGPTRRCPLPAAPYPARACSHRLSHLRVPPCALCLRVVAVCLCACVLTCSVRSCRCAAAVLDQGAAGKRRAQCRRLRHHKGRRGEGQHTREEEEKEEQRSMHACMLVPRSYLLCSLRGLCRSWTG